MLNESPKKKNKKAQDFFRPTKWQYFWRIQKEGWRRMISPYFMYLFMSMLMLAAETINSSTSTVLEISLGVLCILCGAAFNAHLLFNTGKLHYDAYLTGCIHRRNEALGIMSGGDHHIEREYRVWKGFFIGFLIGVPAIILGIFSGAFQEEMLKGAANFFQFLFAGWACVPPRWVAIQTGMDVSGYWSILMVLLPVLVSGTFYILGAMREKKIKAEEAERQETVTAAGKKGKKK